MTQFNPDDGGGQDNAFALFAVLSFLMLAATILIPFVTSARTQALISRNVASELKDRMAMRGLIEISAYRLFMNARQPEFITPNSLLCQFDQASVAIYFQNHAGLIDLNAASADLLALGFQALGVGANDALNLAQATIQFRMVATGPATEPLVAIRGGYKNALFETVDELLDFSLPTSARPAQLKNIFTVHSATGTILDEAVSEPIKEVLKDQPQSATYFVVSGQPPLDTVTASVEVYRRGKTKVLASAIARPTDINSTSALVSPVTVSWQPETTDTIEGGRSPCSDFFEASELSAIQSLVGNAA